MNDIEIQKLSEENFNRNSLLSFDRHQIVNECWRKRDGEWVLLPISFVEEWGEEELIALSESILKGIREGKMIAYAAFDKGSIIGFSIIGTELFGSRNHYLPLIEFEVSYTYRGKGIGRRLFSFAASEALALGAEKLYISAHSSKESQAAYRSLGCTEAEEINVELREKEPCDVQMEYPLILLSAGKRQPMGS